MLDIRAVDAVLQPGYGGDEDRVEPADGFRILPAEVAEVEAPLRELKYADLAAILAPLAGEGSGLILCAEVQPLERGRDHPSGAFPLVLLEGEQGHADGAGDAGMRVDRDLRVLEPVPEGCDHREVLGHAPLNDDPAPESPALHEPVPAAQTLFISKSTTPPSAPTLINFASWPPISMTVSAAGDPWRAPLAWAVISSITRSAPAACPTSLLPEPVIPTAAIVASRIGSPRPPISITEAAPPANSEAAVP